MSRARIGALAVLAILPWAWALLVGCPSPNTGPSVPVAPERIWAELTEAGCMDPKDDAGLASVQLAVFSDSTPGWFLCLRDGGTPTGCGFPCNPTTVTVTHVP